jgi:transposase
VIGHSIGIDLSINGAHDCTVLDATGQLLQRFTFDSSPAGLRKLEQQIRVPDPSHGTPVVVMEPTGLAWFLPCLSLRAQHPEVKVVRIKTSKMAALRRYLKQDAKSDRLDSLTLAKMPLVDPEKLYAVDLPPAALQGLDRMTRQRARLVESLTGRKNRLQALVGGYFPGLMAVVGKPWERACRALLTVSLNPVTLAGQDTTTLREALQDKHSRKPLPKDLLPRLRTACEQLAQLYRPILEAELLTETFFDDVRDELARELRLMDMEEREVKELEAAIARRYQEVMPADHSASTAKRPFGGGPASWPMHRNPPTAPRRASR